MKGAEEGEEGEEEAQAPDEGAADPQRRHSTGACGWGSKLIIKGENNHFGKRVDFG